MNGFTPYTLYILQCSDGTYYTGITNHLERRLKEHNSSAKGAKYTKGRRPVHLIYRETFPDKSSALRREYEIKRLNRDQKIALITLEPQ